jgi:cytochrome c-type biogenesis protein CcmH
MKQNKPHRILVFLFFCLVFCGFLLSAPPSTSAIAQKSTPSDDDVNAIANQLFCPVCENIPLDVCDTEACRQWRNLIRQMLTEGKSEEEIIQYFTDNYGVRVLSEPPGEGFTWLAYAVPPAAFLLGTYLLFRAFRIWKQQAREAESVVFPENPSTSVIDLYTAKFEEKLKRRK